MKNKKFKLIFYISIGVISLLITKRLENLQGTRTKTLGVYDFTNPIQVISNISSSLPEPDFSFNDPSGVAVDTQGNIYVLDTNNDRIQIYDIGTSSWTTMGSEGSEVGQFNSPKGITVDTNSNIYVADSGNNRIQKYDIGTTTWTALGSGGEEVGQFDWPDSIDIDASGNIYVSDNDNNRIQKYDVGTTTWTAMGSAGSGVGYFSSPNGIAVDTGNNIYVTDSDSDLVQKYDIGTTTWTALGTRGTGTGQFDQPNGIAIDTNNNVYVTDRCNGRVQKYTDSLQTWSTIGGSNDECMSASFSGTTGKLVINLKNFFNKFFNQVLAVQQIPQGDFNSLVGIAVDLQGNVYVADSGNNRIQKYEVQNDNWLIMGSSGSDLGQFDYPGVITVDQSDNIYVIDNGNNRIQKYDVGTTIWTVMGSQGTEIGQFSYPEGITVDSIGNIYISDSNNGRIQKYDIGTSNWTVIGNEGLEFGQFDYPGVITVDQSNNVYVVDTGDYRIKKYDILSQSWSVINQYYTPEMIPVYNLPDKFLDKIGYLFKNIVSKVMAARTVYFSGPGGITVDTYGNIYLSDNDNYQIRKYDIGTSNWTIIGDGGSEVGQFNYPGGIIVDSTGNIYVADTGNGRIQRYDIGTTTWSAIGEYNGPINNIYSATDGIFNKLAYLFKNLIGKVMATISVYFNEPRDLTIDTHGNVYVADSGNNRIQKLIYYSGPTFTINYLAYDNGSITGNSNQNVSIGGSSSPVVAVGNSGFAFLEWSDGSIINPRSDVGVTGDFSISASFINTRTIDDPQPSNLQTEVTRNYISVGSSNPLVTSDFTFNLNYTFLANSATVVFPAQTVVTKVDGGTFDLTTFITVDNTIEVKNELSNSLSAIKFGIPDISLNFSLPVTITIPVSTSYNGQTLNTYYKKEGTTNWVKETTCLIIDGNCTFQTTHATTFTVVANTTQTSNNNNNSSPVSYQPDAGCHSSKPLFISDLFQINTTSKTAKIYFTPQRDTNDYFISFSSVNNNAEEHGEGVTLLREGVQSHTIYSLKPNTTYYVKVRGQNGCMPGDWSNIMTFKTNSRIYYRYTVLTKTNNYIKKTTESVKKAVTETWNGIILPKTSGN